MLQFSGIPALRWPGELAPRSKRLTSAWRSRVVIEGASGSGNNFNFAHVLVRASTGERQLPS
jgi:hypothetical protein